MLLIIRVSYADVGFVYCGWNLQQKVNELIEFRTYIRSNCTFEICTIFSHRNLFLTEMNLIRVSRKFIKSQQNLQIITLPLDRSDPIVEFLPVLFDSLMESIFDLTIQMNRNTIMIFELFICIFYLSFRFSNYLVQLFDPFCNNSQNRRRFDKENAVLYFWLCVFWSIFADFPSNQHFWIWFHLFKIDMIFMSLLSFFSWSSFLDGHKDLSKNVGHQIIEVIELFIRFINHVVDDSHDIGCIISIFFLLEGNHLIFGDTTDEIEFNSSFVVNWRNLWSKSYVGILHFSLRILCTKKIKNANSSIIDVLYQFRPLNLAIWIFVCPGELNKIVDDVLSEENFSLIKGEQTITQHIPTNRSSCSVYHS